MFSRVYNKSTLSKGRRSGNDLIYGIPYNSAKKCRKLIGIHYSLIFAVVRRKQPAEIKKQHREEIQTEIPGPNPDGITGQFDGQSMTVATF